MASSNHEQTGKAFELLKEGLIPFVERELKAAYGKNWFDQAKASVNESQADIFATAGKPKWDAAALLNTVWHQWNEVFKTTLGQSERTLVSELREVRNKWAHQQSFSVDDVYRAVDSASRLLTAVAAPQVEEVEKIRLQLLRTRFEEQTKAEKRKNASTAIESATAAALNPWREVITPHKDVAGGGYQQAEFAADLWQVHLGEGPDEYRVPSEFFRRTFLTASLKQFLAGAIKRLTGAGGDPVVQLQTNFGGGKTHSMLALYHLFSGTAPTKLPGVDAILADLGVKSLPGVKRVVLVGNKISPGNPVTKNDGTVIHTLWGELAWQLGGAKAYARIAPDDKKATSPGDALRKLFNDYGPCLILIDEWVAYARQLHDQGDVLPGGTFETQFSFAQVLTESAKLAKGCLLVISLPASDSPVSPHAQADDQEVGGLRGREALSRLQNVIGRIESSWKPATAEEGFEIVRRRLFEPLISEEQYKHRDEVARAFYEFYHTQQQEFPPECREADYERRIKEAYPIHPEIFDRLYGDWSSLVKFQRTRGVLRLMAAVVHSLWEKGDKNPLIMPSMIPIDDLRVQSEFTHYLSDNWTPVISKDVDGPSSLPLRLDSEVPNLGKVHACRRVARTIYLGSAPTTGAAHLGIEERRVKLGCVMPGESPSVFVDALRRLCAAATYLYQDGPRVWYSTQPTVTKLAEDRAEMLKRDNEKVDKEIESRLRAGLKSPGDFSRIHTNPGTSADVPDDMETRLVVLGTEQAYSKEKGNAAECAAKQFLETRGNSPRLFRNTLVFLAVDKARLQDLDEAVRKFLAWESILDEKAVLNLDPLQVRQAENQLKAVESAVNARIPEAYQWLMVPVQKDARSDVEWQAMKLTGQDTLAVRASKRLRGDELLISSFAATRLRMELDKVPLWRGNHVAIKQLAEDFAKYIYLPRLAGPEVLLNAVKGGLSFLTWKDTFAYAESYDETAARYMGLSGGQNVILPAYDSPGLLVKPDVAQKQLDAETKPVSNGKEGGRGTKPEPGVSGGDAGKGEREPEEGQEPAGQVKAPKPRRFHGTVVLDAARAGRDAGLIAEEVISHLTGLVGAQVTVTLEIEAEVDGGVPDNVVRTVTENCRTLKFKSQGFEKE